MCPHNLEMTWIWNILQMKRKFLVNYCTPEWKENYCTPASTRENCTWERNCWKKENMKISQSQGSTMHKVKVHPGKSRWNYLKNIIIIFFDNFIVLVKLISYSGNIFSFIRINNLFKVGSGGSIFTGSCWRFLWNIQIQILQGGFFFQLSFPQKAGRFLPLNWTNIHPSFQYQIVFPDKVRNKYIFGHRHWIWEGKWLSL